jgi:hypothetical protein
MDLRQVTSHYYISVGHRMSTVICLQILTIFRIYAFFPPAAAAAAASSQKGVRIGV